LIHKFSLNFYPRVKPPSKISIAFSCLTRSSTVVFLFNFRSKWFSKKFHKVSQKKINLHIHHRSCWSWMKVERKGKVFPPFNVLTISSFLASWSKQIKHAALNTKLIRKVYLLSNSAQWRSAMGDSMTILFTL
jgi:hypothetical protein